MDVVSYLLGKKSSGGGSGGLEYEEGTYIPAQTIQRPSISFKNEHEKAPIFIYISDASDEAITNGGVIVWTYFDKEKYTGTPLIQGSNVIYTIETMLSATTSIVNNYATTRYSSDETGETSPYPRYYATESYFLPGTCGATKKDFVSGRIYKWIAIWK